MAVRDFFYTVYSQEAVVEPFSNDSNKRGALITYIKYYVTISAKSLYLAKNKMQSACYVVQN